jgi:hypothetical protein
MPGSEPNMTKLTALLSAVLIAPVAALAQASAPAPASPAASTPAPAATATAIPAPCLEEPKFGRELGGHLFLPSHIIDNPFSDSAFGITFGLGAGEALGPQVQLQPPAILPSTKWYGYTSLGIGVVGSYRILEYLSVRALLATNAYLGTGNGAILTVGSSARITVGAGVKGSLPIGDNVRLAATFDLTYGPVYSLLIAQGLVDAINSCRADPANCNIDPGTFLQQQSTVSYIPGLVGSWAPWPFLGVTGDLKFLFPTKTGKASYTQNGIELAAMVDFDAKPLLSWLPVGVNAAYSIQSPLGSNGVTTLQEYGFGFYYTGRKDLALGLELDWKQGRLENTQVSHVTLGWLNFKYYWN